jgi:outer membrane receptor protein involved in Fe transport
MRVRVAAITICLVIAGAFTARNTLLAQETSGQTASDVQTEKNAAKSPNADEPPKVIVTARKRSERLQDVPIAVSALSGETLQAVGYYIGETSIAGIEGSGGISQPSLVDINRIIEVLRSLQGPLYGSTSSVNRDRR